MPNALLSFLSAPHIHKVGVQVTADLKRLFKDCGYIEERDQPFVGALELGRMAKECGAASKANIGLADLCGSVRALSGRKRGDLSEAERVRRKSQQGFWN